MYDKNFNKIIEFIFGVEKGYNDGKYDAGGETNLGITHLIYDEWTDEDDKAFLEGFDTNEFTKRMNKKRTAAKGWRAD